MPGQRLAEAAEASRPTPIVTACQWIDQNFEVFVRTEHGSDHGKRPDDTLEHCLTMAEAIKKVNDRGVTSDWVVRRSLELRFKVAPTRWRLTLRCEAGHVQVLTMDNFTEEMARDYASILDGSSPFYVHPPQADEKTWIGRCAHPGCGRRFTCQIEAI